MIGEILTSNPPTPSCENKIKKRSLDSAGKPKENDLVSPPAKKMKQARLPFAPKMTVSNCMNNAASPGTKPSPGKKLTPEPKKRRLSDENGGSKPHMVNKAARPPVKPVAKSIIVIEDDEELPSSSSEAGPPASRVTPPKSNSLDGFLQTTQQPQVTTSATVIDLTDDSENNMDSSTSSVQTMDDSTDDEEEATSTGEHRESGTPSTAAPATSETTSPTSASVSPTAVTTTQSGMPQGSVKSKKSKSQKALEKEQEKQKQREEKAKLREEKRLRLEAEKAAKDELRKEIQRKRKLELEEVQKEKEARKKEKQARRAKEEQEREERRKMKQEARQKKQEELDLLQAEKRKKQEERVKQELEKKREEEEAKKKNQKQQMMFKSFFKKPCPDSTPTTDDHYEECGPFAAFQLRRDMVIAPTVRTTKMKSEDVKKKFEESFMEQRDPGYNYLRALAAGDLKAGQSGRTKGSRKSIKDEMEQDHDSDVEEVQSLADSSNFTLKAKLFQFHENHRPAYYGTWRKTSKTISGRKPFNKDEDLLDYEVDSDDEWEDPGESLSDSGTEDEEDSDGGDESDDGFFVPHGYLSEDEDDAAEDDLETWEKRRAAKAKDWDHEMKKKTEQLKTTVIGCIWSTANSAARKELETLGAFRAVPLMTTPIVLTGVSVPEKENGGGEKGESDKKQILAVHNKIRPVPKEAMPDLIRLVHGNIAGIKNLCREFKEFWRCKHSESQNSLVGRPPSAGGVAESSPLFRSAEDFEISKRQLEKKITKMAVRDKRDGFSKICWYVHEPILKEYKMEAAPVPSDWVFVTRKPLDQSKPTPPASPATEVNARSTPVKGGLFAMFSPVSSSESAAATLQSLALSSCGSPLARPLAQGVPLVPTLITPKPVHPVSPTAIPGVSPKPVLSPLVTASPKPSLPTLPATLGTKPSPLESVAGPQKATLSSLKSAVLSQRAVPGVSSKPVTSSSVTAPPVPALPTSSATPGQRHALSTAQPSAVVLPISALSSPKSAVLLQKPIAVTPTRSVSMPRKSTMQQSLSAAMAKPTPVTSTVSARNQGTLVKMLKRSTPTSSSPAEDGNDDIMFIE